uniref:Retrotransposon Copia-like N-terminal domain-containing protein n=1 Tax=Lactuca sativa TaxID=4236 RepID=A0A9R1VYC6_LACSA|nr:hypothetical protein LSAT_V11C400176850 [Lactuca sativa]
MYLYLSIQSNWDIHAKYSVLLSIRDKIFSKPYNTTSTLWFLFQTSVSLRMSTSSAPVKSSTIATAISCKLTRTNFLLWKAQVVPILRGLQLFGHLDGTTPAPPQTLPGSTSAAAKETVEAPKKHPIPHTTLG